MPRQFLVCSSYPATTTLWLIHFALLVSRSQLAALIAAGKMAGTKPKLSKDAQKQAKADAKAKKAEEKKLKKLQDVRYEQPLRTCSRHLAKQTSCAPSTHLLPVYTHSPLFPLRHVHICTVPYTTLYMRNLNDLVLPSCL